MPLEESRRKLIRDAHAAGKTPNRQASGRITLPLGDKRYVILARGDKETEEGTFYKSLAGANQGALGLGGDRIVRHGSREFLQMRRRRRSSGASTRPRGSGRTLPPEDGISPDIR